MQRLSQLSKVTLFDNSGASTVEGRLFSASAVPHCASHLENAGAAGHDLVGMVTGNFRHSLVLSDRLVAVIGGARDTRVSRRREGGRPHQVSPTGVTLSPGCETWWRDICKRTDRRRRLLDHMTTA